MDAEHPQVRDLDEAQAHLACLYANVEQLQAEVRDHAERFSTLQTPLWKRVWFRIDGWPGQRDLNAPRRRWRPWHRRH